MAKIDHTAEDALQLQELSPGPDFAPARKSLHWLPTSRRIDYKILSLAYRCLDGTAPLTVDHSVPVCWLFAFFFAVKTAFLAVLTTRTTTTTTKNGLELDLSGIKTVREASDKMKALRAFGVD